jgi:hypothetical protein
VLGVARLRLRWWLRVERATADAALLGLLLLLRLRLLLQWW